MSGPRRDDGPPGRGGAAAAREAWARYQHAVLRAARPSAPRPDPEGTLLLRRFARLYRPPGPSRPDLAEALWEGLPRLLRAEARWVARAAAVYAAVALVTAVACARSPAWQAFLLPAAVRASLAASLRSGLRPAHSPAVSLSVMLFFHNIAATAVAYAGGVFVGLGALGALAVNAALLGGLAGWMAAHGVVGGFWALIAPHGALELPATFCAGGGGLAMGAAWLAPGERSRWQALFAAGRRTAPLFGAAVVLLAAAALVEGLFTPQPLPAAVKLGVAALVLLALGFYVARPAAAGAPARAARGRPDQGRAAAGWQAGTLEPVVARLRPLRAGGAVREGGRPRGRRPSAQTAAGGLAIRLPEGVVVHVQRAGVPSRALAFAVDAAVLAAAFVGSLIGIGMLHLRRPSGWVTATGAVFTALFFGLYAFLFEWLGEGATPGKRALGLRVLGADGRPAGVWAALARNLLRVVDFLPAAYLLGGGLALGSSGARLGDLAGGTVVVHAGGERARRRRSPPPVPALHGATPEPEALRRVPRRARARLYAAWAAWSQHGDSRALARLRAAVGGTATRPATPPPRPRGHPLRGEKEEAVAAEHLLAALHRAGLLTGRRFAPCAARDRAADLGPLCPGPGTLERLPPELAAAVGAFWGRRATLDGPALATLGRALAVRLAAALGAPELGGDDPEALVEHVAHALGYGGNAA